MKPLRLLRQILAARRWQPPEGASHCVLLALFPGPVELWLTVERGEKYAIHTSVAIDCPPEKVTQCLDEMADVVYQHELSELIGGEE
jgi:hypothetical protein